MQQHTLKEHVQGRAVFECYRDSALWYRTSETRLLFPVPIEDTAGAIFKADDAAVFFMRWIRRYVAELAMQVEDVAERTAQEVASS